MTNEELRERIRVMQAFLNGEEIQYFNGVEWYDTSMPAWNEQNKYRIKPKGDLRPYTLEELEDAIRTHGVCVKDIESNNIYTITSATEEKVYFFDDIIENYQQFLINNVWLDDNSPCGIEMKEI